MASRPLPIDTTDDGSIRYGNSPILKLPRGILITTSPVPTYHRLACQIRELVLGGAFAIDEQLPPEGQIAEHLHISRSTVRQALGRLEQDRLIRREHGRGTFVNRITVPVDP